MPAEPKTEETKASNNKIPAWIECEDLLVKMREELTDRAIKLLNREIKSGHIAVNGSALFSSEASADVENAIYLINNLIDDSGKLHQEYNDYIAKNSGKKLSEKEAKKFEELQKFVLSVEELTMLMEYGRVLSSWADAASKLINAKSKEEILKQTIGGDERRKTVLEFFINNKTVGEAILSKDDYEILNRVLVSD
jgi:hypothetical protein